MSNFPVSGIFVGIVFGILLAQAVAGEAWMSVILLCAGFADQLWRMQKHWVRMRNERPAL